MQGNYEQLKAAIAAVIKTNGNNEITGALMQQVLQSIVSQIGQNGTFAGIATPATNPGTPDQNVFYLASESGVYPNFAGYTLEAGHIAVFANAGGAWAASSIAVGSSVIGGYVALDSIADLPESPSDPHIGYIIGTHLYVYVGTGGDTDDGKYKDCGEFKGDKGDQGNSGYTGAAGELEVVNNLTDGGATSALSAEMGIVIRDVIEQIFNALGEYSFPNGKPTIDWAGGSIAINLNLSDFSSSNMAQTIQRGEAYTTTLTATDLGNLYVPNVVITMGGEDITNTTYNPATGVVNIIEVTSTIEITAQQVTYVQDGLVFNLDGLNRGGNAGHWIDFVGNTDFVLTNCTENTDNVEFNGTSSKGVSSGSLNVLYNVGTIESIFDVSASNFPTSVQCVLTNKLNNGISIGLGKGADPDASKSLYCYGNNITSPLPITGLFGFDDVIKTKQQISISKGAGFRNGETLIDPYPNEEIMFKIDATTPLAIGYRKRSSSENFMKGQIFAIRVYSRVLTTEERAQNYLVDKLRYNLG